MKIITKMQRNIKIMLEKNIERNNNKKEKKLNQEEDP
jgi:hypothetical protein